MWDTTPKQYEPVSGARGVLGRSIKFLGDRVLGTVEEREASLCSFENSDPGLVCCGPGWNPDKTSQVPGYVTAVLKV